MSNEIGKNIREAIKETQNYQEKIVAFLSSKIRDLDKELEKRLKGKKLYDNVLVLSELFRNIYNFGDLDYDGGTSQKLYNIWGSCSEIKKEISNFFDKLPDQFESQVSEAIDNIIAMIVENFKNNWPIGFALDHKLVQGINVKKNPPRGPNQGGSIHNSTMRVNHQEEKNAFLPENQNPQFREPINNNFERKEAEKQPRFSANRTQDSVNQAPNHQSLCNKKPQQQHIIPNSQTEPLPLPKLSTPQCNCFAVQFKDPFMHINRIIKHFQDFLSENEWTYDFQNLTIIFPSCHKCKAIIPNQDRLLKNTLPQIKHLLDQHPPQHISKLHQFMRINDLLRQPCSFCGNYEDKVLTQCMKCTICVQCVKIRVRDISNYYLRVQCVKSSSCASKSKLPISYLCKCENSEIPKPIVLKIMKQNEFQKHMLVRMLANRESKKWKLVF